MPVGGLYPKPLPPAITKALYLCRYPVALRLRTATPPSPIPTEDGSMAPAVSTNESLSLDDNPKCPGGGLLARPQPVGYTAARVRTGFWLAARCRTPNAGMYISLNLRCENPIDRYQGGLGSMRAAKISITR